MFNTALFREKFPTFDDLDTAIIDAAIAVTSLTQFRADYPQFDSTDDDTIQSLLTAIARFNKVQDFRAKFPEFAATDDLAIEVAIDAVYIESHGYLGLAEPQRSQALGLHAAAFLMFSQESSGQSGAIKSVESRNDKIGYATKDVEAFSMDSNQYGKRLTALLRASYF